MKILRYILIISLSFAIPSCSNDDDNTTNTIQTLLLSQQSDSGTTNYTYNNQNRLTSYGYTSNIPADTDYTMNLVYNNQDQVIERNRLNPSGVLIFKDNYFYNSDGKIKRIESFNVASDGTPTQTFIQYYKQSIY